MKWLVKHKIIGGALVIAFSIGIILLHDKMVEVSIFLMDWLTLQVYNKVVAIISIIAAVSLFSFLAFKIKNDSVEQREKLIALIIVLGLLFTHAFFMFEMNIEIIHSLQYAILAFLMFSIFQRYGAALIFSLPVMIFDEWYQYIVLYPGYTKYFEFNDIVLDLLGATFAMLILWIGGIRSKPFQKHWLKILEFTFLIVMIGGFAVSILTCLISFYTETACKNTYLILNTLDDMDQFWHIHHFTQARYHILNPISGTILVTVICFAMIGLDRLISKISNRASDEAVR